MKSWGVERDERTASRSVIPHGSSSHMPSHSQGTERRPERRAGGTAHRCAPRARVVSAVGGSLQTADQPSETA
ncbi:hypothetical protein GCM10009828_006140 [Actinoplanes couchii]|uniref:Uncharacterized protein n=1 Tax=Actinoplanes couchii TaxID=403638 RepID=A0ABQ3XJY3_9ACTN|nr:hypothetical protein Aco03nite_072100 [Actinoplanes couchii]